MKDNTQKYPKVSLTINIDKKVKDFLEKRAKKELLSLDELITDILRRSVVSYSGFKGNDYDKVDDKFLTYFSRKNRKRR